MGRGDALFMNPQILFEYSNRGVDRHRGVHEHLPVRRESQVIAETRKELVDLDVGLVNYYIVPFSSSDCFGPKANRVNGRCTLVLGDEIKPRRVRRPNERSYPMIETLRQIRLSPRFAVVQHQPELVALVSRTLLGAVGDVTSIGRIERGRVAGGIVGG